MHTATSAEDAPIRLCEIVNNFDLGGLEKVVLSLLDSLDPERFEVSVVCLKGAGALYDRVKLPRERVLILGADPSRPARRVDVSALLEIRRFLAARRIEVVHAHNFAPLIYGGIAARGLFPRPRVVYSEHNQVNSASERDLAKFRWYSRLADQVVTVSADLRRVLIDKLHVTRPVGVIRNGIDSRPFRTASGASVRRELGILPHEFVVGTAAVLSKQKGMTHFVEAARQLLVRFPAARFVIAGDGPLRGVLEAQATACGLGDRMVFAGYRSDMPDVIDSFDVFVLPSLWEGLPLVLLEALCLGKPIVATDVGGNREIVAPGVHGLLVPAGDPCALAEAIFRVGSEPTLRATAKREGPERFRESFSLDAMTASYATLFSTIVRPPGSQSRLSLS